MGDSTKRQHYDSLGSNWQGGTDARIAPGKGIKISQSINNINKINLETAEVDSKEQVKAYKEYQAKVAAERQAKAKLATINNRIKNSNTRAAELAKNIPGAKGGVRQTYATAKHKVYCDNLYNLSNQGYQKNKKQGDWQQHYVYNPISDKMVPLESVMDNNKQLKGAKVMYITENGYATLTDGRTIHISFDNFDNQMSTYVETLKTNYEASVEDLKKDAALSRANMEKMKTVDGQDIERTDADNKTTTDEENNEIADVIYSAADYESGGAAAKSMYSRITKHINKNNVMEVYETYQQRHSDDDSMIDTITSEWLGYGAGHGRDYAVRSAKYLLNKFIERARTAGVPEEDLQQAKNSVEYDYHQFINDHWGHTSKSGIDGQWTYDNDLACHFQKIIKELIPKIKTAEATK